MANKKDKDAPKFFRDVRGVTSSKLALKKKKKRRVIRTEAEARAHRKKYGFGEFNKDK